MRRLILRTTTRSFNNPIIHSSSSYTPAFTHSSSSSAATSRFHTFLHTTAMSASASSTRVIVMDPFCLKQFTTSTGGQHIAIPGKPEDFVDRTNAYYHSNGAASALKEGYAPFCKHLFIPASEFPFQLACAYAEITDENRTKLESTYSARTEKELPVLTRYFAKGSVTPAPATYLDVILYSRAQIDKENAAMKDKPVNGSAAASSTPAAAPLELSESHSSRSQASEWEWGIVSVKPQNVSYETPMNPITIIRNALGVEEGGSGIPLDRTAYMKSVEFWQKHALMQ